MMRRLPLRLFPLLICALLLASGPAKSDEWPQWGGPERDLVWRESGIVDELPTTGLLPRVWSAPIGEGYAGPAVAQESAYATAQADGPPLVYVTDYQRERRLERVHCLNAETGEKVWGHEYRVVYTVDYPNGPRSTPVVDSGRVYTIGAMGDMICFDAITGEVLWRKNFVDDYGTELPTWGMAASPLVDGEQLVTLVGGADGALVVSFDKASGAELWRALDDPRVGYAPPVIFNFGETRQLIIWHPTAVSALEPGTGKLLWSVPFWVEAGLTIATPRKAGNRLLVSSFYNGSMLLEVAVDGSGAEIVWQGESDSEIRTDGLHSIIPTPWLSDGHVFGVCSYGQLRCLDARTGERIWETFEATGRGRWWNAFLIPHEDRFFIHNEQGDLIIARLSGEGYDELSRAKLVEPTRPVRRRMTIWSHPAFALKSVFARNDREIVRVNLARPD